MDVNEIMKDAVKKLEEQGASPERIARVEIAIQYIGNPEFREKLNDYVFNATYKKGV